MYSLWEISTDSIVITLIVVCISALAIAWLFAGRRRPPKGGSLEQRRLEGREADVCETPTAPSLDAPPPEPVAEAVVKDTQVEAPLIETPAPEYQRKADADAPFPSERKPKTSIESHSPAISPEKASAMSIAAALVRHDKREAAPPKPDAKELPLGSDSPGDDDLTAIGGIDHKLAKS